MKIFNLNADEWDRTEEREGWRFKDAWVGAHTDAELIGASMYEVSREKRRAISHPPRERGMVIVLRSEPTLRTQRASSGSARATSSRSRAARSARPDPQRHGRARPRPHALTLMRGHGRVPRHGKIGTANVAGERIIFARPGPELEYWEGED